MTNRRHELLLLIALLQPGAGHAQALPAPILQASSSGGFVPSDDPRSYASVESDAPDRFFSTDVEAARRAQQQMQERLRDPLQRQALQAETRTDLKNAQPDLAQFLRLDAATEQRLFDVLADQAMVRHDQFARRTAKLPSGSGSQSPATQAGPAEDRYGDQVKALLGPERWERYRFYQRTRHIRSQLSEFEERLGPGAALRADQQQQLLELLQELDLKFWQRPLFHRVFDAVERDQFSGAVTRQRRSERLNIEKNERVLRAKERAAEVALERVAQFLKPGQVQAYARWEADKLTRRRAFVQRLRAAAQLPSAIPQASPEDVAAEQEVPARVGLAFSFQINGAEPASIFLEGDSGSTIPFDLDSNLSAEARPTLFANGDVFVLLRWFERGQVLELPMAVTGLDSRRDQSGGRFDRVAGFAYSVNLPDSKYHQVTIELNAAPLLPAKEEPAL